MPEKNLASVRGSPPERDLACDDLLEEFRSDGIFTRERTAISGDEQHGQCNACRKEGRCYGAG